MVIRKKYRIESAHIVRNAISVRCSHSYHGHSGVIEVFFKADHLDNAGMIYDFGAFKETIGSFIDMFDHAIHLWHNDKPSNLAFFVRECDRFIILPCNPTAENYCVLFRDCINDILRYCDFTNGEGNVYCSGVRYHETESGYAESDDSDPKTFALSEIIFSKSIIDESSEFMKILLDKMNAEKRLNEMLAGLL